MTPGQAVSRVYKYRYMVMTEGDLEILKSGLTDSQVIGMTSKFNTTWSWESLPTSRELLLQLCLSWGKPAATESKSELLRTCSVLNKAYCSGL